jgi:para-aminobenzoate synthetase/4-amino-4-deoxychorismate lyase
MRWVGQKGIALLDRHLARMESSARYFGFPFDETAARDVVEQVVGEEGDRADGCVLRVRLLLAGDGTFRAEAEPLPGGPASEETGTRHPGPGDPPSEAGVTPSEREDAAGESTPPRVGLAPDPVDPDDVFLYHKTTRREVYERARSARPELDDVLLWNEAGEMTESCVANLVVEIDGENLTPPLACGLLPGTLRSEMLEQGMLTERVITREDLQRADAIYLVSALRGLRRVRFVPE